MAIRTGAVLIAVFAPLPVWARALAIALGVVLPWVSVTQANAGPLPEHTMQGFQGDRGERELTAGDGEKQAS